MEKTKPKPKQSRIALQLPAHLDEYFARLAAAQLTSKSAVIRSVLASYVQGKTST